MRRTLLLCLTLAAAPALAETAKPEATPTPAATPVVGTGPSAVAQFMAAQDLFTLGRARKDPLAVIAAARLAALVTAQDVDRLPEPQGEGVPASHPDATTMFTAAKALAAEDEAMTDLVTRSMAEAARLPPRTMQRSTRGIAAGEVQVYTLPFFGGSLAEVGLLGDGKANLDLSIAPAKGDPLCLEGGPGDRVLCSFLPAENGDYTVTVTNRSETAASYSLLTN